MMIKKPVERQWVAQHWGKPKYPTKSVSYTANPWSTALLSPPTTNGIEINAPMSPEAASKDFIFPTTPQGRGPVGEFVTQDNSI